MNKSPINYLITFAISCFLWVITGLVLANHLNNTIFLSTFTVEKFLLWYRLSISAAALISLFYTYHWFFYGSKDSTAGDLNQAKRTWNISFIIQFIVAVVILFIEVIIFMNQGIAFMDYLKILGALFLHTFVFFWFCTFLMSPRAVKYLVPLKK